MDEVLMEDSSFRKELLISSDSLSRAVFREELRAVAPSIISLLEGWQGSSKLSTLEQIGRSLRISLMMTRAYNSPPRSCR